MKIQISRERKVKSHGLAFSLVVNSWITKYRWTTHNTKEPMTLDWISQLNEEDILFDIGANIGQYSIQAALSGVKVIAFEPEYSNAALCRDNIKNNKLESKIDLYSIALGLHSGLSHLHLQDLTPGAALLSESRRELSETYSGKKVIAREGIACMRLDDVCKELKIQPTAIKIDVDGTEKDVVVGGCVTLQKPSLRSILIEDATDKSAAFLRLYGFHRVDSEGDNHLWRK